MPQTISRSFSVDFNNIYRERFEPLTFWSRIYCFNQLSLCSDWQTTSRFNAQILYSIKEDSNPETHSEFQWAIETLHGDRFDMGEKMIEPKQVICKQYQKKQQSIECRGSKSGAAKGESLPDLKEMLANEAKVLVSWYSLMLFFKDFLLLAFSSDMQHWKQFIFLFFYICFFTSGEMAVRNGSGDVSLKE